MTNEHLIEIFFAFASRLTAKQLEHLADRSRCWEHAALHLGNNAQLECHYLMHSECENIIGAMTDHDRCIISKQIKNQTGDKQS